MQKVAALEKVMASLIVFIPTPKLDAANNKLRWLKSSAVNARRITPRLVKLGNDAFYNLILGILNCQLDF